MERIARKRTGFSLALCCIALVTFSRTPGADSVRWIQIILLMVAGMCVGLALEPFLRGRREP